MANLLKFHAKRIRVKAKVHSFTLAEIDLHQRKQVAINLTDIRMVSRDISLAPHQTMIATKKFKQCNVGDTVIFDAEVDCYSLPIPSPIINLHSSFVKTPLIRLNRPTSYKIIA